MSLRILRLLYAGLLCCQGCSHDLSRFSPGDSGAVDHAAGGDAPRTDQGTGDSVSAGDGGCQAGQGRGAA